MLSRKDIVLQGAAGIIVQGRPATDGFTCVYRAVDGSKCAIGQLIPEDKYDPNFEGASVGGGGNKAREILEAAGIDPAFRTFASNFQRCHDNAHATVLNTLNPSENPDSDTDFVNVFKQNLKVFVTKNFEERERNEILTILDIA
jgi:hypothetical protein